MLDIQEPLVAELKRLTKQAFNLEDILTVAGELKYTREIKRILNEELNTPSEEFVKFLASQVYSGKLTAGVRGQFTGIIKRAFTQFINEHIAERLRTAMGELNSSTEVTETDNLNGNQSVAPPDSENKIVTTDEKLQGYYIVRGIVCSVLDIERITYRDTQSYFGILCDDINRRPICRLHFNGKQKYVGVFNVIANKGPDKNNEEKIPIANLNEIYKLADRLKATAEYYANTANQSSNSN